MDKTTIDADRKLIKAALVPLHSTHTNKFDGKEQKQLNYTLAFRHSQKDGSRFILTITHKQYARVKDALDKLQLTNRISFSLWTNNYEE